MRSTTATTQTRCLFSFWMIFVALLRSDTTERSVRNQATVYTKHDSPQGTDGIHDFLLLYLSGTGGTFVWASTNRSNNVCMPMFMRFSDGGL